MLSAHRVLRFLLLLATSLLLVANNPSLAFMETQAAADWIPVPPWLAGTWRAHAQTVIYSYNHRVGRVVVSQPMTIKIKRQSTIGFQRDATGQIWHFIGTPYERVIDAGDYAERQQIESIRVVEDLYDKLSTRSLATVTRMSKADGSVIDAFREETVTTYKPVANGVIETEFDIQDFDFNGQLIRSSRALCTESRVRTFKRLDSDYRGDLRNSFKQFIPRVGRSAGN